MSLNVCARTPISSCPDSGIRRERSPPEIERAVSVTAFTGRRTWSAKSHASTEPISSIPSPTPAATRSASETSPALAVAEDRRDEDTANRLLAQERDGEVLDRARRCRGGAALRPVQRAPARGQLGS